MVCKLGGTDTGEAGLAIKGVSASVAKGASDHPMNDNEVQALPLGRKLLIS
jgi:hypothetical protein